MGMSQLFLDLDTDGSGSITREEFMSNMQLSQMKRFLKAIDLDPQDSGALFNILDRDGSDEIDSEELVSGCLRLHGTAKALDLAVFMHDYELTCNKWDTHFHLIEKYLSAWIGEPIGSEHSM